jgi:hypothetical protein
VLGWQTFMAVWAAILFAALVYMTGPRLILLGLAFFGSDGDMGRQHRAADRAGHRARVPLAGDVVVRAADQDHSGHRAALVRGQARVALAGDRPGGHDRAVVAVPRSCSMPDAWRTWPQVLANNVGKNGTWAAVPIPFVIRLPFALLLVVWGARKNHRWTVPVSAMLACRRSGTAA